MEKKEYEYCPDGRLKKELKRNEHGYVFEENHYTPDGRRKLFGWL